MSAPQCRRGLFSSHLMPIRTRPTARRRRPHTRANQTSLLREEDEHVEVEPTVSNARAHLTSRSHLFTSGALAVGCRLSPVAVALACKASPPAAPARVLQFCSGAFAIRSCAPHPLVSFCCLTCSVLLVLPLWRSRSALPNLNLICNSHSP